MYKLQREWAVRCVNARVADVGAFNGLRRVMMSGECKERVSVLDLDFLGGIDWT